MPLFQTSSTCVWCLIYTFPHSSPRGRWGIFSQTQVRNCFLEANQIIVTQLFISILEFQMLKFPTLRPMWQCAVPVWSPQFPSSHNAQQNSKIALHWTQEPWTFDKVLSKLYRYRDHSIVKLWSFLDVLCHKKVMLISVRSQIGRVWSCPRLPPFLMWHGYLSVIS